MNKLLYENLCILSGAIGFICAFLALIPYVNVFAFGVVLCLSGVFVLIILQKMNLLKDLSMKQSLIIGSVSGFIAYLAFCLLFIPVVYLLSLFFKLSYLGGLILMLKMSSFWLILLFVFFVSTIAVIFNSFSSLIYYYVSDSIRDIDRNIFKP